jgi:hypothetical protein
MKDPSPALRKHLLPIGPHPPRVGGRHSAGTGRMIARLKYAEEMRPISGSIGQGRHNLIGKAER